MEKDGLLFTYKETGGFSSNKTWVGVSRRKRAPHFKLPKIHKLISAKNSCLSQFKKFATEKLLTSKKCNRHHVTCLKCEAHSTHTFFDSKLGQIPDPFSKNGRVRPCDLECKRSPHNVSTAKTVSKTRGGKNVVLGGYNSHLKVQEASSSPSLS